MSFECLISCSILKIWYKTIIERKVVYKVPVWFPILQPSHGERLLNSIHRKGILLVIKGSIIQIQGVIICTYMPTCTLFKNITRSHILQTHPLKYSIYNIFAQMRPLKLSKHLMDSNKTVTDNSRNQRQIPSVNVYTDGSNIQKDL